MRDRLIRFLMIFLLALPASGVVAAPTVHHSTGSIEEPCSTHVEGMGDECPCCPDNGKSIASCLSACAVAVALPVTVFLSADRAASGKPAVHPAVSFSSRAELPYKPPPIR